MSRQPIVFMLRHSAARRGLALLLMALVATAAWQALRPVWISDLRRTATLTFTEGPSATSSPINITQGPDGRIYYVGFDGFINAQNLDGSSIVRYPIPSNCSAHDLALGPDAALWFTEPNCLKIGRIDAAGTVTEYPVPHTASIGMPWDIVRGADQNLWFTLSRWNCSTGSDCPGAIGRVIPAGGSIQLFATPTVFANPTEIVLGPDGNVWFSEPGNASLGRAQPDGTITDFPGTSNASQLAVASDGRLWFSGGPGNVYGVMTTAGVVTSFSYAVGSTGLYLTQDLIAGPDGNAWFSAIRRNDPLSVFTAVLGTIDPAGNVVEYLLPPATRTCCPRSPEGLATDTLGRIWYVDTSQVIIGNTGPLGTAALIYVAVGDSYSSGEGAPPFENGANYPQAIRQENTYTYPINSLVGNGCHRSLANYAKLTAPLLAPGQPVLLVDRTCSGAEIAPGADTKNGPVVTTPATAGRPDISQVKQATDRLNTDFGGLQPAQVNVVTATMGGNDAGFGDLIQACLIPNVLRELFRQYQSTPGELQLIVSLWGNCATFDALQGHTDDKIAKLANLEPPAQEALATTFSNARVFQLTYPDFVPGVVTYPGDHCGGILNQDAYYARSKAKAIDQAIRDAGASTTASHGNFQVVDLENAFGINPLCPSDAGKALVNGLKQEALTKVIQGLVASGTPFRALLDKANDDYRNWKLCMFFSGLSGPLLCQGQLAQVVADGAAVKGYFTTQVIADLVNQLAPGGNADQSFDNSRLLFHPTAAGWKVMSCNLIAVIRGTNQDLCQPPFSIHTPTYSFNGVNLSTTNPLAVSLGTPIPFQFNGFDVGSPVNVSVWSDHLDLGTFTADASGTVAGSVTLPVTLNPGVHRVEFRGANSASPRSIDVLVRIAGRPRGGEDYGLYFSGFGGDSGVQINYGGLAFGTVSPDASGGFLIELPVPFPARPGSIAVVATGITTNKTATQVVSATPRRAAVWATAGGPGALTVSGAGLLVHGWAHSDGGAIIAGAGIGLETGLEYATTVLVTGAGVHITPGPVQIAPGGEPLTVNVADWRPGGPMSAQLGSQYSAIPLSACVGGTWRPRPGDLTTAVVYVPCGVNLSFSGSIGSAIVAEGPITVSGAGLHLTSASFGFSLVSGSTTPSSLIVSGSGFQAAGALWTAGDARISGAGIKLACGVYARSISLTGAGMDISACTGGA